MVLVADNCGGIGYLHPVQDQVYEMVEQTPAGKESVWKVG